MLSGRNFKPRMQLLKTSYRMKQSRFRFHRKYKLNPNDNHLDSDFS
ncbi:unnamed protein product [Brassica napus]|uniref:(rape) hypothetical protein n=1 Tax=Brassica napus TaxID=3708 RepID=A0A816JJE2_BRANA|nr:unnamed protein product [Brassica napus]